MENAKKKETVIHFGVGQEASLVEILLLLFFIDAEWTIPQNTFLLHTFWAIESVF